LKNGIYTLKQIIMIIDIQKVWIEDNYIFIKTKQGEVRNLAIQSFKLLRNASKKELLHFTTDKFGIHWPVLDEDLSYEGFFK